MLRLQREKKQREIAIRFRDHEPFFNRNFLRAFCLALGLHLFGFFFIEIDSFTLRPLFEYEPIVIETPKGLGEIQATQVSTSVDRQGFLARHLLNLEPREPKLLKMPTLNFRASFANERPNLQLPSFAQIENFSESFYQETFDFLHFSKSVKLRLYGDLAKRKAWVEPSQDLALRIQRQELSQDLKVNLDIRVDDRLGRVFWASLQQSSGNSRVDALALELMEVLHFEKAHNDANSRNLSSFVTQANLELFFPSKF